MLYAQRLVEGVGAGAPVDHEHGEADSLEHTGESTDRDLVHGALLGGNLGDDLCDTSVTVRKVVITRGKHTEGAAVAIRIKEPR